MSRGIFTGRCYLCGEIVGATYCTEHRWAAAHLALPYRREQHTGTSMDELLLIIARQEQKLEAWRRTATRRQAA